MALAGFDRGEGGRIRRIGRHIRVTPGRVGEGRFVIHDTSGRRETLVNQELALAHPPMVLFVQ